MSYPEHGAAYRNKPAWLDRAVAGEKRAQGGPVEVGGREVGNGASVREVADAATEDAKDDLSYAMGRRGSDTFHDSGLRIPGKLKAQNDRAWPTRRADGGGIDTPKSDEQRSGRVVRTRADGGDVPLPRPDPRGYAPRIKYREGDDVWPDQPTRKKGYYDQLIAGQKQTTGRAEGGPLIDSKGRTTENEDNEFRKSGPARLVEAGSGHAAQDARDQAAERTRRTRAMPNSFPVGGEPKEEELKTADHRLPYAEPETAQQKMGRGIGQSIGFKRGGRT